MKHEYLICFSGILGNSKRHMELAKLSLDCLPSVLSGEFPSDCYNANSTLSSDEIKVRLNDGWNRAVALNQTRRKSDPDYDPSDFYGAFFWESTSRMASVNLGMACASLARFVFDEFYEGQNLKGKSRFKGIQITVVNELGEYINFLHGLADEKENRPSLGWSFDSESGKRLPDSECMLKGDFLNGLIDV